MSDPDYHDSHERDPARESLRLTYHGDEKMSTVIVEIVAALVDSDPRALEPMFYSVDIELLNRFSREESIDGEIRFDYHDFRFTVTSKRRITIRPKTDALESDVGCPTATDGTDFRESI